MAEQKSHTWQARIGTDEHIEEIEINRRDPLSETEAYTVAWTEATWDFTNDELERATITLTPMS